MELLIDIPEWQYEAVRNGKFDIGVQTNILCSVIHGIPLSEGHGNIIDVNSIKEISLSNITYHMVWQPRNDTELKCRIEAPILVKSDAVSEIIVRTESEKV